MIKELPAVLSDQELTAVIGGMSPFILRRHESHGSVIALDQIQPSSVDLTLGNRVYGMGVASLPGRGEPVASLVARAQYDFTLDDGQDGFLHRGYTYIVPLNERLALPRTFSAKFSPKSSIGRTDVFVRVLADGVSSFDYAPDGYQGYLYLEITPLSFPVFVRPGLPLVQMRIKNGDSRISAREVMLAHAREGIFFDKNGAVIPGPSLQGAEHGIYLHIDFDRDIAGFVSRTSVEQPLSLSQVDTYDPLAYWEPIPRPQTGLALDPGRFYLLATRERVRIPTSLCGDIAAYDAATGEFRTHYAGFFDPGFGGTSGVTGVLEVRGREMPHRLSDGDPVCLMVFERVGPVEKPYRGNYQHPGPSLSKHFKQRTEVWGS